MQLVGWQENGCPEVETYSERPEEELVELKVTRLYNQPEEVNKHPAIQPLIRRG